MPGRIDAQDLLIGVDQPERSEHPIFQLADDAQKARHRLAERDRFVERNRHGKLGGALPIQLPALTHVDHRSDHAPRNTVVAPHDVSAVECVCIRPVGPQKAEFGGPDGVR